MKRSIATGALVALAGILWAIAGGLLLILVVDVGNSVYPGAGQGTAAVLCIVAYGGLCGWLWERASKSSEEDDW